MHNRYALVRIILILLVSLLAVAGVRTQTASAQNEGSGGAVYLPIILVEAGEFSGEGPASSPTIMSSPTTEATAGKPYNYDVDAVGKPAPVYALTEAPGGMVIEETTGMIRWTPEEEGVFGITVKAVNEAGADEQSFSVTVRPELTAPEILSLPPTEATKGYPYRYDVEASGEPAPAFSLGQAPDGMTIDEASGEINWTPAAAGTFAVMVEAENQLGSARQTFALRVAPPPVAPSIISTPIRQTTADELYVYDVLASGEPAPTFALTWGPDGMMIDETTGEIRWTPAATGEFSVTVAAMNTAGRDEQVFSLQVNPPPIAPSITSAPVAGGTVGEAYVYDVDASGDPAPSYALQEAPAGMTIDAATGRIDWMPQTDGDFVVTVQAANVAGVNEQTYTLLVYPRPVAPTITSTPVAQATVGQPYVYDTEADGEPAPTYRLDRAPVDMVIDETMGVINWTPSVPGVVEVTVAAVNAVGMDEQTFALQVNPPPAAPSITSKAQVSAIAGEAYRYDVDASGEPAPTYSLTLAPTGMTINETTGVISWTPATFGTAVVIVQAINLVGTDEQTFNLQVDPPPAAPVIMSVPVTAGLTGLPYVYTVSAVGEPAPAYQLTQAPVGMTIEEATGTIVWTPGAPGIFDVSVEAVSEMGIDVQSFSITVVDPNTQLPELVSYWKLDETGAPTFFFDERGANVATCSAELCPTPSDGQVSGAQLFDGSVDGLQVAAAASLDWDGNESFSIEAWVKGVAGETCTANDEIIVGRVDNESGLRLALGCSAPSGYAVFQLQDVAGNNIILNSTKPIGDGAWHHIAAIRDGAADVNRLYVDGIEVASASTTYSGNFRSASAPLRIGYDGNGAHFTGRIDEVALYGEALDAASVRGHYYLARGYTESCTDTVAIMPLGDSITQGFSSGVSDLTFQVSYRKRLWDLLAGGGYSVDFVGSLVNGEGYGATFDPNHEGHPGWADAQIRDSVVGFLNATPADVVLLHIGTNYLDPRPNEVEQILNNIDSVDTQITVILARIINRTSYNVTTTQFNNNVAAMAQARIANGDKIILVDMEDGAGIVYAQTPGGDMWDSLHPYASGYDKMANVWASALTSFLPRCN